MCFPCFGRYVGHFLSAARRTLGSDECATSLSASAISCRIPKNGEPDPAARVGDALDLRIGKADAADVSTDAEVSTAGEDEDEEEDNTSFAHTAHVAAFPIGIAPERFLEEMRKGETQEAIRQLQDKFGNRKIMLGIDRLDPIKGIPHKLLAFER